ncbi:MAG: TetR/AcrR family transcriptional regulator [Gemmatimonadota bacterium]|nr:TetR/AcrR family transcriptional regulator [Gemmatimonadota bacterium]
MSIPYERTGRSRQKQRTRDALVAATRALIAEGATPTVEDAAARAEISRTTAYRYFPNQRALLIAAHPEIERKSLLGPKPPRDPAGRLAAALAEMLRITVETEPQLRMALRLSLDTGSSRPDSALRRGRAITWLEDALAPLLGQLSKEELRRLVCAIRSAAGIEALVWLTDVARVSRAEAVQIMTWSAMALLRAAIADGKRKASRRGRGSR